MSRMLLYGQLALTPLQVWLGRLQTRLDDMMIRSEEVEPGDLGEEKKGFPTWAIILIVVVVLCLICGCLIFFSPAVLTLLGPGIEDTFDNIIEQLE